MAMDDDTDDEGGEEFDVSGGAGGLMAQAGVGLPGDAAAAAAALSAATRQHDSPGRASSSSGEGQHFDFVPGLGPAAAAPGGLPIVEGVSAEEFARLQDELLALKMYNQELQQERKRLIRQNPQQQSPSPPPGQHPAGGFGGFGGALGGGPLGGGAGAAALQRSFSNFQAGTAAMAAFGQRAQASLQNAAARAGQTPPPLPGTTVASADSLLAEGLDEQDREALRAEMQYLRARIKATLEEAEEFKVVASDAQQVVDAKERAAAAAKKVPVEVPAADETRRRLQALLTAIGGGDVEEAAAKAEDEVLLRIARIALELVHGPLDGDGSSADDAAAGAGGAEGGEEKRLIQSKIDQQQEELKRYLEIFHHQQAQIAKLIAQVSNKEDEASRELRRQTKARLKEAEKRVEATTRQLEASEEASRNSQDLRARLRGLAGEASQRDVLLGEMRSMLESQEATCAELREHLHMSLEDLAARAFRRAEASGSPRRRARAAHSAEIAGAAGASPASASSPPSHAAVGKETPSRFSPSARQRLSGCTSPDGGIGSATAEASAQAVLVENGDLASLRDRRRLRAELDDLRVAKAVLEKRTARELRELRALVPRVQQPPPQHRPVAVATAQQTSAEGLGAGAGGDGAGDSRRSSQEIDACEVATPPPEPAAQNMDAAPVLAPAPQPPPAVGRVHSDCVVVDISSDGEEERGGRSQKLREKDLSALEAEDWSAGGDGGAADGGPPEYSEEMLCMQRVEELEERTEALRAELGSLHEAERSLKARAKERNELIAHLLERVDVQRGPAFGAAAAVGRSVFVPPSSSSSGPSAGAGGPGGGGGRSQQAAGGALPAKRSSSKEEDVSELESIVEDTMEDNIRLRNDIQIMSEEFRRVLAAGAGTRSLVQGRRAA